MGKESYKEREQWFLDRIGKRIYRENNGCPCEVCQKITDTGLIIADEMHASYLNDVEAMYNAESEHKLKYTDNVI